MIFNALKPLRPFCNRLRITRVTRTAVALFTVAILLGIGSQAFAQDTVGTTRKSLLEFINTGGFVGYTIIALSIAAASLAISAFLALRPKLLMPDALTDKAEELAAQGRFADLHAYCKEHPSMLARTLDAGLDDGTLGIDAVREAMTRQGQREITRLHQMVGYLGLIAAVAPILGLLGTVLGMISSFDVLGTSGNAAKPDELAVGISEALVTTCLGLILALPAQFVFTWLRDRTTRVGQELAADCEKVLRLMATILDMRARGITGPIQTRPTNNPRGSNAIPGQTGSVTLPGPIPTYTPR
jgi:biopolymer transport protein ExbB